MQKTTPIFLKQTYKKNLELLSPNPQTIKNILLFAASVHIEKFSDDRMITFWMNQNYN